MSDLPETIFVTPFRRWLDDFWEAFADQYGDDVKYIRAPQWQPIETAQGDDRVLVAGWQPPKQNMQGYWWWEEAYLADGVPVNYPTATHWAPVLLPPFPPPPQEADTSANQEKAK